jgi:hypothetical protein
MITLKIHRLLVPNVTFGKWVVSTLLLTGNWKGRGYKSRPDTCFPEFPVVFPIPSQEIPVIRQNRPRPLSSFSIPINYLLVIRNSVLLKDSCMNKYLVLMLNEKNGLQQLQMESCQPIKRLKGKNKKAFIVCCMYCAMQWNVRVRKLYLRWLSLRKMTIKILFHHVSTCYNIYQNVEESSGWLIIIFPLSKILTTNMLVSLLHKSYNMTQQ